MAGELVGERLGGPRGAREVYDELLCDWPLLAPDDARTLTDAVRTGDPVCTCHVPADAAAHVHVTSTIRAVPSQMDCLAVAVLT
jgi:hypothetical protein